MLFGKLVIESVVFPELHMDDFLLVASHSRGGENSERKEKEEVMLSIVLNRLNLREEKDSTDDSLRVKRRRHFGEERGSSGSCSGSVEEKR
jgi:hypothetical protein